MLSDNMSALHMTRNPVQHVKSKHIEIDYHFIRDQVLQKSLRLHIAVQRIN